ncbi:MAG: hypothetical protein AAFX99_02815 [Myxococcota bacterium]
MSRFYVCVVALTAGLLALPSVVVAQDCDPETNPACFCSDIDGFPCDPAESEDCFCEDFSGGGESNGTIGINSDCLEIDECVDSCNGDELSCVEDCADQIGGEAGAAASALISCIESSGCSMEDDECLLSACSSEVSAYESICLDGEGGSGGGDGGGGTGENNGTVSSVCDDFFVCTDQCFDLSCVNNCASSNLSGDASTSFNAAISCIENSGCGEEDEDCLFNACGGALDSFAEACFGSGATVDTGGGSSGGSTNEDSSSGGEGGVVGDGSDGSNGGSGSGGGLSGLFGGGNRDSSSDGSGSSGGSDDGCTVAGHGSGAPTSGGLLLMVLGAVGLAVRRRRA